MPRIPLIEDLLSEPLPAGTNLLVEFDPRSLWYAASLTIAAGWLKTGGTVAYGVYARHPDKVRSQLRRLGLSVEELENGGRLEIHDYYSATIGKVSKDQRAAPSMKVADMSIQWAKETADVAAGASALPDFYLRMHDNLSVLARFNDEKAWVDFELTRRLPRAYLKSTLIAPVVKGLHSEWLYKHLEAAVDGVVEFDLEEVGRGTRNLVRITSMRDVAFDSEWHELKTGENLEVTMEKKKYR